MTEPTDDAPDFDPIIPVFREWAILKQQSDSLIRQQNHLRDRVIAAVEERGYRDHKGSQFIDLPYPLPVGDIEYVRIKRECRTSIVADHDAAEEITRERGVFDRAFVLVPSLRPDELYVLLQEGILSESDMDRIFTKKSTYAFRGLTS
ncbi:hypothetical protein ACFVGM_08760 [Kitasatospora purpeofusca]|uniref:hypothetical protein n=1 Tax=Kitasatospora purpeofusca TaxID=67352 RepID=UPI0036B3EA6F